MKQTRQKILSEVEVVAKKPRFGLFSQPPPIALGDNSYFHAKSANRGEDGKPRTKARNMLAGPNRTGMGRKAFIDYPDSIYQKDPYSDPAKIDLHYHRKTHAKSVLHEANFRPASKAKTLTNSPYPHVDEDEPIQPKQVKRDENGRVKTEPSNVLTSPISKIEWRLFRQPSHMKDEYARPQEIEKQDRDRWRSKITGETMFRSTSHGGNSFTRDRAQYGLDDKAKMLLSQRKPFVFGPNRNRIKHEMKFKLARRGHGDPIGRYPQFMDSSGRTTAESRVRRLKTEAGETDRDLWRPSTGDLTRPTPSITLLAVNLRRQLGQ